jgi:hypothetical protein
LVKRAFDSDRNPLFNPEGLHGILCFMKRSVSPSQRVAQMPFAAVYPLYLAKIEKKGRTRAELNQVIRWLTGHDGRKLQALLKSQANFEVFFEKAQLNPNAGLITGTICGHRVELITDPLMKKVRYLDKLVDELAKGWDMERILRSG